MTDEQPKEEWSPFEVIRFLVSCIEAGEKLTSEDYDLIARCQKRMQTRDQQLAQARQHAAYWEEEFRACRDLLIKQEMSARQEQDRADTAEQQLAQARALLLRSNDLLQPGFGATDEERQQHAKEIRAFLAAHPSHEQGDA